ncbi:MAG: addiction module antidote protein [Gammaproteobacteria bacterium]
MKRTAIRPSRPFDVAEHLDSPATIAVYLDDAIADGDPALLASALRDVLRSRVFSDVAAAAGLSRESLHRTLSMGRDARFTTLASVLKVIGCRLAVVPAESTRRRRRAKR